MLLKRLYSWQRYVALLQFLLLLLDFVAVRMYSSSAGWLGKERLQGIRFPE
jgi:hypothetical protein